MPSDEEVIQRAGSLQAMTGLPEAAFMTLLPQFERALVASRQHRPIDGQPRTRRRYRAYDHRPVPTRADQWLLILTSVQQHPLQAVQGQLCGRSPSKAHKGIHRLRRG
jgi:hypothetical protein